MVRRLAVVVLVVAGCSSGTSGPSPESVAGMSCTELQEAWQSHRRGEWDAPGTFNLLVDEIDRRC